MRPFETRPVQRNSAHSHGYHPAIPKASGGRQPTETTRNAPPFALGELTPAARHEDRHIHRFWLLTWTTYGTWLPGDDRGSVTRVREDEGSRVEHDRPQTPYIGPAPGLKRTALANLKGEPIFLTAEQAEAVAEQLQQIAEHRKWSILAAAVIPNHAHVLVGVPGDPEPYEVLGTFKSWASRRLNQKWHKPASDTWRTAKGSMRKKADWPALKNAVEYVRKQNNAHVVCVNEDHVESARTTLQGEQWA